MQINGPVRKRDLDTFFLETLKNAFPQFVLDQVLIAEFGDLAVQGKIQRTFPEPRR